MLSNYQAAGLRKGITGLVRRLHDGEIDDYTDEQMAMWYEIFLPVRSTMGLRMPTETGHYMAANPLSREEFEDHLLRIVRQGTERGEYVMNRLLNTYLEEQPDRSAA